VSLLPSFFLVQVAFVPLPIVFMQALRDIEVETSVGQASAFRLHFDLSRSAIGDFDVLTFDIFRPLVPIRISVSMGLGLPQTLINGYVKDARVSVSNEPGGSTLEVSGMDALGTLMSHIQQPFTWPELPDSEIARALFGKYGVTPMVIPTPPLRTSLATTTTQRVNDSAFLQQLAARHSYELYIQPDPVAGLEVGHFHPPLSFAPPQGVLSIDFGTQTNLTSFSVSNDMLQPTTVVGIASEPRTRAPVPILAFASHEPPMGLEPTLFRIIPPPVERIGGTDAASPAELLLEANARVTESSRSVRASGEVDSLKFKRPLLVGLPVLVRGAGRQMSGSYYVTSVTHRISRDGYTQQFSAWRNAVTLTGAEVFIDPLAAVP
jgi:hypothetical protein